MSEERKELTDGGEKDGIVSGTFPSGPAMAVEVFEGCCCVADCDQGEKDAQQEAGTMEGSFCCPEKEPSAPGKTAPSPPQENEEEQEKKYAGMCEQIKLQLSLFGGPYWKFAVAFEPILDVPPGLPDIPNVDLTLFGVPELNLPSLPGLPLPGVDPFPPGSFSIPGLELGFFNLDAPNIPSFPGLPFLNMSLMPINLAIDLFKLKLPEIPDFNPCEIAKFHKQIPQDFDCAKLPSINANIAICWLCMLLFFLFIVMPILIILLGMKEKGLLDTDSNGDVVLGSNEDFLEKVPPKIKILSHHPSNVDNTTAGTVDNNPIIFVSPTRDNPTKIHFQIGAYELRQSFGENIFENHEVVEQTSPRVQPETVISGSEGFIFDWSVHEPPNTQELAGVSPSPEDFDSAFNSFKNAMINPPSLERRKVTLSNAKRGNANNPSAFLHRVLTYNFTKKGLHEVYCTVTLGEKSVVMASYVQIGKPEKITALPPILKALPRKSGIEIPDNTVLRKTDQGPLEKQDQVQATKTPDANLGQEINTSDKPVGKGV